MAFGYYAASALCPACWHSRTPCGSSGFRVPCLCSYEVKVILSLPAIRRANHESVPDTGQMYPDCRITFWSECLSQFHSSGVTTLRTQVSFVSIDHRGSPSVPSDWVGRSLSAGFTPLEMPFPDACRLPLASRSKCCSFEQLHKRLQAHPTSPLRTVLAPFNAHGSLELSPLKNFFEW